MVGTDQAGLPFKSIGWVWVQCCAEFVRDATFNVSHWLFAFEYYTISRFMPFVVEGLQIPSEMVAKDKVVYVAILSLNLLIPLAEATSLLIYNLNDERTRLETIGMITMRVAVGVLQIVSGVFLGYAILKVKRYLSDKEGSHVNARILAVFSVMFGLYMVCVVVYNVFWCLYYKTNGQSTQSLTNLFVVWIVCVACSMLAQICLCAIFCMFGRETF